MATDQISAIHIGCRPVGKAGRDLSAALAETHGYALTDEMTQVVTQMQQVADALELTERDCLALDSFSTKADYDKIVTDLQAVSDAVSRR
jgi:hypothetical protein